jgi:acetyltransferase
MKIFFEPASIAIVGASKYGMGHRIMLNMRSSGYRGALYGVNRNHDEIEGVRCYPSLEAIPDAVELAIILVQASRVPDVLQSCARKKIGRVIIESGGFAEVGEQGRLIQDHCKKIAKENGIRIWGPNCMGLVDIPKNYLFTFMHPRTTADGFISGRVSMIVQSGMLSAVFMADAMNQRGIGFSKVCSIGNKMDIDECDLLDYLLEDPETDVIALYLENISRGRLFAERVVHAAKPIVLLMGGTSRAGTQAALSHTASLSGNQRLARDVLRTAGVIFTEDFHQMIDMARDFTMLSHIRPPGRTAILTFSGGASIVTCDLLEKNGLEVARFSDETIQALGKIYPAWMPVRNPVDLFPSIQVHGSNHSYGQAISIVMEDPNVDVLFVHEYAGLDDHAFDLESIRRRADELGKVLVFWIIGRREARWEFIRKAQSFNFPVHGELSRAVECLSAITRYRLMKMQEGGTQKTEAFRPQGKDSFELTGSGGRIWDEYASKRLLKQWNIPVVEEALVPNLSSAIKTVRQMDFPVVLKGLLPGEIHKTELGLVHLGVDSLSRLKKSFRNLKEKMKGQGQVLMQHQADIGYELIAGFLRDDQYGPCIMFGLGGVFAELQSDVVFAIAPLQLTDAMKLIRSIRNKRLLEGFRGMTPLRQDLMADLLINLGNLGLRYPEIEQIDINPVAVLTNGAPLAVDATVIMKA